MNKQLALGLFLLLLCIGVGVVLADYYRHSPDELDSRYVGRDSCVECHPGQAALFTGSDHDLAMDLATDATVLADFDNQSLEHYGTVSKMFRDGKKFMVTTDGPDGKLHDYEVKYVFGVRPLQQYMVELDRAPDAKDDEVGRVQVLRLSWDTERNKWFYLMPPDVDEPLQPSDPLHWTGITQNWNASCASCHSTDLNKNFDPHSGHYHTTFSEIDVSCEACHGPGEFHVELANRSSLFWDRKHGKGLARLKVDDNVPQIESCAPCHSRRVAIDDGFRPGCSFDDYYATQVIAEPIYHADGQVRDEDYVYGSFIQSKMYHNGIKCSDCHDPHSTRLKHSGNQVCTSCHQHPSGKYDTPSHHHHVAGQPGSNCVDCHMPATTYMMVDARRDHSFRVPRPDMSLTYGTPNACTGCHLDESKVASRESTKPLTQYLDWINLAESGDAVVAAELERVNKQMQQAIETWYDSDEVKLQTRYYELLAAGLQRDSDQAVASLLELAPDETVPDMIRASALSALGSDDSKQSLAAAVAATRDDSPKVAAAALYRLEAEISRIGQRAMYANNPLQGQTQLNRIIETLAPMLSNESLRVRTDAARVFATLPGAVRERSATPRQLSEFNSALEELEQSLRLENDRDTTFLVLGSLHELLGQYDDAERDYRQAIKLAPENSGARTNLAALLEQEANQLQNELRSLQSGQSGGGIQVGQLKAQMTRIQELAQQAQGLRAEEHQLLARDLERSKDLPDTHGLHFRFAKSSYLQRDLDATEKHMLEAYRQRPDITEYQLFLATFYVQMQQPQQAQKFVNMLLESDPRNPGYLSLQQAIRAMPTQ